MFRYPNHPRRILSKQSPKSPNHTKPGQRIIRPNLVSIFVSACFVLITVSAAGCGGGDGLARLTVNGSVTIDGEPVPDSVVRFKPANGTEGPMTNTMITDGRYNIPADQGPVARNYTVQVQSYQDPNAVSTAPSPATRPAVASDKLGPKKPLRLSCKLRKHRNEHSM